MSDRVSFDFETGEIIWDTDSLKGTEIDVDLCKKKDAILSAAGYEQIGVSDFTKEFHSTLKELGCNVDV